MSEHKRVEVASRWACALPEELVCYERLSVGKANGAATRRRACKGESQQCN